MEITAAMVKELRERTQAGMMDCKKALVETNGDMEKAIEYLREKGLAANAKKAGRVAAEGMVDSHIHTDGKVGVLVEVNCETDFVANTDSFRSLCHDLALQIAQANPKYVSKEDAPAANPNNEACLLEQPFVKNPDITVQALVNETALASGEKISVRRFTRYEGGVGLVDSYIHMGGKIGVLVEVNCETDAVANSDSFRGLCHDLALQIAASNPLFVRKEDVPTENLNKEREILRVQALNEGKPEKIVDRMVEGRIEKYYKEVCLLEQPFVKDPDITVQTLVNEAAKAGGEKITVRRFTRYERGEGIEKKVSDLAGEIEAMTARQ